MPKLDPESIVAKLDPESIVARSIKLTAGGTAQSEDLVSGIDSVLPVFM